jgi:hypothetical protein
LATAVNGGNAPVYLWKVNGTNAGTNSPVFSYTPQNNDQVRCMLTSNALCMTGSPANSNVITMSVESQIPAGVSIASSANPVCSANAVILTATPVNGGTAPVFQWKVNGNNVGNGGPTHTYMATDGDSVYCVMTSNSICATGNPATSNGIKLHTIAAVSVSVSIAASANSICAGTTVTFTATPVNGGSNPVFQWKVNGNNVGTNSPVFSYNPSHNHKVTCVLTSGVACTSGNPATSNQITMIVFPLYQVKVTIATASTSICAGASATFTATVVSGGTLPVYQWKVNGLNSGTSSPVFTYIPSDNDNISCTVTSNASCVTNNTANSNQITMTVSPNVQVAVSIASNPTGAVCSGTPVIFTAMPVNGGSSPVYQWKVNGTNAGTNSPVFAYNPINGDVISCSLTSSVLCGSGNPAVSNTLTMSVIPVLPVSVTVSASQNPFCQGSPVIFNAIATNGGSHPYFQWKVNGMNVGTNNQSYTYTPANGDNVSCILTSDITCPSGNPATSNAIVLSAYMLNPTITGSSTACLGNATSTYSTQANMTGYQWNVSAGGEIISGTGTNTITVLWSMAGAKTVTVAYGNPAGCVAQTPGVLNLTVYDTPGTAGIISGPMEVCVGTQGVAYSVAAIPNASGYLWKVPFGVTVVSGAGTRSIAVNFSNSAFIGDFSVKGTNICFTGAQSPNLSVKANALLTGQVTLANITIPPAHQECLAAQSITTAGSGTTFLIEGGGEVTLIASQFIRFLPGTTVQETGFLHAFITNQCIPCSSWKITNADSGLLQANQNSGLSQEPEARATIIVYPNPSSGIFTLEINGITHSDKVRVEIFSARGEKLLTKEMIGERKHLFSLSDRPAGIYFVRVITGQIAETIKVVRN